MVVWWYEGGLLQGSGRWLCSLLMLMGLRNPFNSRDGSKFLFSRVNFVGVMALSS